MNTEVLYHFASHDYINLETFRRSGVGVRTPLMFAVQFDTLYCYTRAQAGKLKRIRNNPGVRLAPCTMRGGLLSEWVAGKARIVTDPHEIALANHLIGQRYGWQKRYGDVMDRLTNTQRVFIALTLEPEPVREPVA